MEREGRQRQEYIDSRSLRQVTSNLIEQRIRRDDRATQMMIRANAKPPLSVKNLNANHLSDFKQPEFPQYDETVGDPFLHVRAFENKMILWAGDDALMCKMFLDTLKCEALHSYSSLPARSITTYGQLITQFQDQYKHIWMMPKGIDSLFALKKKANETPKAFTKKFKSVCCEIPKPNSCVEPPSRVERCAGPREPHAGVEPPSQLGRPAGPPKSRVEPPSQVERSAGPR
jgi:hypothetical protein